MMEYFQIQGDIVSINIIAFFFALIIPVIITIVLYRYIPKIFDFLDRKFLDLGSYIVNKVKSGMIFLTLFVTYRKIGQLVSECPKKSLDSLLQNITTGTGKQFILRHNLEEKLLNCLKSKQPDIILTSLKIFRIIINTKGPGLQIKCTDISKIIDLLSNQNTEIQDATRGILIALCEEGPRKELMYALKDERSPDVEKKLADLCLRFFNTYSPELFLDAETIKPIFRFLEYDDGTLRYNLLVGFWKCANKKILKMSHIIHDDKKNMFRTILSGTIIDQRIRVLSIFYILAQNHEQKEIVDSGFLPLIIQNLLDPNEGVRHKADHVLNQLLKCDETKDITNKLLIESNAKGRLMSRFTI